MSHNICVKLAPVLTDERWDDPKWMRPGRAFYWPGSLALMPRRVTPLVVDHDLQGARHRHRAGHDAVH